MSILIQFNVVLKSRACWGAVSSCVVLAFPCHTPLFIIFTDEAYTFPLDVACKKKSEKELNEKDEERIGSVRALRKWALERQDWLKTPVGRYK